MPASVTNRRTGLAVAALLVLFCAGCGLKGDLYLPDDPPPDAAGPADTADDTDDG